MSQLLRQTPLRSVTFFVIVALSTVGLLSVLTLFYLASSRIDEVLLDAQELTQDRHLKARLIGVAVQEELLSLLLIRDVTVYAEEAERAALLAAMRKHEEGASKAYADLESSTRTAEGRLRLSLLLTARDKLAVAKAQVVLAVVDRLPTASDRVAVLRPPLEILRQHLLVYVAAAADLQDFHNRRVIELVEETTEHTKWIRRWLVAAWALAGGVLLAVGLMWRLVIRTDLADRDKRIDALTENRDTLVREVHHRIKNHLQGILGLIEDCQSRRPDVSNELSTLHGHVVALAAVHGLQARRVTEDVILGELLDQQVVLLRRSHDNLAIAIEHDDSSALRVISSRHAVPLALTLTELLINASKHGRGPIAVRLWSDGLGTHVTVSNAVDRLVTLDIVTEAGFGTGLALVKSMVVDIGDLSVVSAAGQFAISLLIYSSRAGAPQ